MSDRIAEFISPDDALLFARVKGSDFHVCGGINLPYAVRPKERHELATGREEPHDVGRVRYEQDPDEDQDG